MIREEGEYKYFKSEGDGDPIVLLHGLMGELSNFEGIINEFGPRQAVYVPILPIFETPVLKLGLESLLKYVEGFCDYVGLVDFHILGNSLGGHLTLLYALKHLDKVKTITITGSSGLFESAMGNTFPKRGNKEYIRNKVQDTFYDPKVATDEIIDTVFETVNDRNKVIRILKTAKSAIRHNLENRLNELKKPTLIVWGRDDKVTPLFVGEKFNDLIPGSELVVLDKCGHAPMMEHPGLFNEALSNFLEKYR